MSIATGVHTAMLHCQLEFSKDSQFENHNCSSLKGVIMGTPRSFVRAKAKHSYL